MDDVARLDRILDALPPEDRVYLSGRLDPPWKARRRRLEARDETLRAAAAKLEEKRPSIACRRLAIEWDRALRAPESPLDTPLRFLLRQAGRFNGDAASSASTIYRAVFQNQGRK